MINMIWAMDEDYLIGNGDKIPWHIKEDLVYYRNKTRGKIVLMGEATYYSLKGYYKTKPLPYGTIYVASLDTNLVLDDATVITDVVEFVKNFNDELWVVGGATIYRLCMPYADNLYISFIKGSHEGDKYFDKIDFTKFNLVWKEETELVRYTQYERI